MKLNKQQQMLSNINASAEIANSFNKTVTETLSTDSFKVTAREETFFITKQLHNQWYSHGIFRLLKGRIAVYNYWDLSKVDFYIYKKELAAKLALVGEE